MTRVEEAAHDPSSAAWGGARRRLQVFTAIVGGIPVLVLILDEITGFLPF